MRTAGLDASSDRFGFAVVDGDELVESRLCRFRPKEGWNSTNVAGGLLRAYHELGALLRLYEPCALAVELVSVTTNMDTVRKIAYFEAAGLLAGSSQGLFVEQVRATTVRKGVLGKGNLKKKQVHEMIQDRYGAMSEDEADATVLALWMNKRMRGEL